MYTWAALGAYQKAENIKVTGRLDADTKSHLIGQASSGANGAVGLAGRRKALRGPSAGGSPSAAPAPPSKTQKP